MQNILIIRFSSLGDVVLTTGVIKYLKENRSDINIDILTRSDFAGVFTDFPYIRNLYCIDKGANLESLLNVLNTMPQYDSIYDFHSNIRSRFVKMILPYKSYTYKKNSLARRLYVSLRLGKRFLKNHVTEKYFLPLNKGLNIEKPELEKLRPYLVNPYKNRKTGEKKTVTIHPFASKKTKEWPFIYELCQILLDNGLNVKVVGAGKTKLPKEVEDLTGYTPLNMLIRNIADSDVVVSTDSGPMHIAIALGLPTIAIFGPTTKEFGFYPKFNNCTVIEDNNLKCRPCHIHGSDKCPKKDFKCMMSATIEEVRTKIINAII